MPAELLIRPGRNDHRMVEDLVAPGASGRGLGVRPPIGRLVLDAPVVASRPQFAEAAVAAGLPVLVDPMTFLLQQPTDPDNAWSRLPFATADALDPESLADRGRRRRLVARAVDFQLQHGATIIVPPYFGAAGPADPWFELTLGCLHDTAEYLRHLDARLPINPVLAGRLDRFARPAQLHAGVDRFAEAARDVGAQAVAALLGPAGKPKDNYAKVLHLFTAVRRLRRPGLAVHAWRQGAYGAALVAAGLQGYETGVTYGESTDLAAAARCRRPAPPPEATEDEEKQGGGGVGVYIPALGRSVARQAVEALDAHLPTRALLVCDDPVLCCPHGMQSTLGAGRRAHAVRSRARYLAQIDQMPTQASWRLHKIAADAQQAAHSITVMNKVLERQGLLPLTNTSHLSLAAVAQHLRGSSDAVA